MQNQTLLARRMREAISVKNKQSKSSLNFFHGNIAVIAVSSGVKGFGAGLISTYVSLYFVELGGSPVTLGLMTAMASMIGCVMFPLGGFIADHYGRRRIIVLTAFYSVFFPLLYAVIQDWRLFAAHACISNPASHALLADSISPEKRTTGIASLQVISSLQVTVAPRSQHGWFRTMVCWMALDWRARTPQPLPSFRLSSSSSFSKKRYNVGSLQNQISQILAN
jgi:MFS family permease